MIISTVIAIAVTIWIIALCKCAGKEHRCPGCGKVIAKEKLYCEECEK